MNEEAFSALVERYLDREATSEEVAKLQELLRRDSAARERFWQAAEWHALYRQWGEQEWGRAAAREEGRVVAMPKAPTTPAPRIPRVPRAVSPEKIKPFPLFRWVAGLAAAAALILALTFLPSTVAPIATLERVVGAQWLSAPIKEGSKLRPTQFSLKDGAAVLALNRGARVIVEGPAEVVLKDDNSVFLRSGRLRAWVPQKAHGFKVETPDCTAVDLGTEFGCEVLSDGSSELHVFAGAVDLHPGKGSNSMVRLFKNQARRVFHGAVTPISVNHVKFLNEVELNLLDPARRANHEDWRSMSQQLDEDPAVVLHYDFQGPLDNGVMNRARPQWPNTRATIVGAQRTEGRWQGKAGLHFQSADDRLELNLPGSYSSLTLLAWVRVDELHSGRNSLLMGRGNQIGDVHWYLYWNGSIGVGVLSDADEGHWNTFHSERALAPKDYGKWVFIASVLNGETGTATHYLNGEFAGVRTGVARPSMQLAPAEAGNYTAGRKPNDPPSLFSGSIDEVTVFQQPLSADEIARLYRLGKLQAR